MCLLKGLVRQYEARCCQYTNATKLCLSIVFNGLGDSASLWRMLRWPQLFTIQMDYSNVIYLGLKFSALKTLQLEQNAAACLLNSVGYCKHSVRAHCRLLTPLSFNRLSNQAQGLSPALQIVPWPASSVSKTSAEALGEDCGQQVCSSGTMELSASRVKLVCAENSFLGGWSKTVA